MTLHKHKKNKMAILMRHAKSDWNSNAKSDKERPLSNRGLRDAPKMALWMLSNNIVPDIIITSPAKRALHTAQICLNELGISQECFVVDDRLYGANSNEIITTLNKYLKDHDTVLLVGHNPTLDQTVQALCKKAPELTDTGKLMTTANLALLPVEEGQSLNHRSVVNPELIRPKEIN